PLSFSSFASRAGDRRHADGVEPRRTPRSEADPCRSCRRFDDTEREPFPGDLHPVIRPAEAELLVLKGIESGREWKNLLSRQQSPVSRLPAREEQPWSRAGCIQGRSDAETVVRRAVDQPRVDDQLIALQGGPPGDPGNLIAAAHQLAAFDSPVTPVAIQDLPAERRRLG